MKRRSFVKTSLITTAATAIIPQINMAAETLKAGSRQFYELRVYTLKNEAQQKLVEDYFRDAAIPALNRIGVNHVGVFTELKPDGQTKIFVLTTYNGLAHLSHIADNIGKDAEFKAKGAAYLNAPA